MDCVDETTYENIHIDSDHSDGVENVNSYNVSIETTYENIHIDSDHSDGVDEQLMKIYILIQIILTTLKMSIVTMLVLKQHMKIYILIQIILMVLMTQLMKIYILIQINLMVLKMKQC